MNIRTVTHCGIPIAVVDSDEILISDLDTALDLLMDIRHQTNCDRVILEKRAIIEDFFILSTRLAGEVLQKFITYRCKLAIVGDFSHHTSGPLHDFIYESNGGTDIFFLPTVEQALDRLSRC